MMNNINIGGMNAMGGPVGGMPMMSNGAAAGRPPTSGNTDPRAQLNTYIYEYFLRNGMYECAKALLQSEQPLNVMKESPGRRRDDNGNGEEGGEDSKEDFDHKRPTDLPDPNLPKECPESCFLYEWWCLFWDMFNAQRGKADRQTVLQYFTHTQTQSRSKQDHQALMLRGLRNDNMNFPQGYNPMRNQTNGVLANPQNELRQKAIQNTRNAAPPQLHLMQQAKQQQMQRDSSGGDSQQRPQSPASAENVPSPSKRPRLDGAGFNPQAAQMPNGRGQGGGMPQQVGITGLWNPAQLQFPASIERYSLTAQQFQNMQANPNVAAQRLAGYQASLGQQQQSQMPNSKAMPNAGGPQNQGSPMMTQGQDGGNIANYYSGEIGPNGMRSGPGQSGGSSGNHALQDYQMQLMLLEQQNKKRLLIARAEQDNLMPRDGGQGPAASGPNGQPFQGTSPQGRSVNSPNPGDQIKRTPHMNATGIPSPVPEGQSRGSPSGNMNFGAPMDPSLNPQYFNKSNGMDPNMAAMANGMRPPSSHPNFNQMTQQIMARQQQAQQQQSGQNWQQQQQQQQQQSGPNGQPMMAQASQPQTGPQQAIGTPQQRNMPPPSMPPGGVSAPTNGRTPQTTASPGQTPAPPTPLQANKANPKKKTELKDSKTKRPQKKGSAANLNAGATPSADAETSAATPTPATPMTPVHKQSFSNGPNGAVQAVTNGQSAAPSANIGMNQQPDPLQGGGFGLGESAFGNFETSLDFANPGNGTMDVLQDFDFDSFLHQDAEGVNEFNFDTSGFMDGDGIGAE